jgi:two-component system OmpR family sensor kinase
MTALRDQTDKEIRGVIGDEKAQKFQDLTRQNRGPGGGPGGGFPGGGFPGGGFPGGGPPGGGFFGGPGQGRGGPGAPLAAPNP